MKKLIKGIVGILAIAFTGAAMAALSPEEVVRLTTEKVLERVRNEEAVLKADTSKLYDLVNEVIIPHFDFQKSSQLVLGKYWRQASDDQRTRFTAAFKQLLVRTYANALFQYVDETITYKPTQASADGKVVVVPTQIEKPGGEPIPVNYRMQQKDGEWKCHDVFVNGISLVVTYRDSFASEIGQSSIDALIDHMENHNSDLASNTVINTSGQAP